MTEGTRRMPPGADLFSRGSVLYYRHPEAGDRYGYAEYDSRREAFLCRTCNVRMPAGQLVCPCKTDGCGGTMRFDGQGMVCDRHAEHRIDPDPLR